MTKGWRIALGLWALLQLPRLIAVPLILSVMEGTDQPAWMFPAIIDVVVAAGVPVALWLLARGRGFGTWIYLILWLALSVFDHASAVTAFLVAGVPDVFRSFGEGGSFTPAIQAVIDIIFMARLMTARTRVGFGLG